MTSIDVSVAKRNSKILEDEIDTLAAGYWDMFKFQYKPFWEQSNLIFGLFKSLKPLLKEDRERLWERYLDIRNTTKQKQQDEKSNRDFKSRDHRKEIIAEAERAKPCSLFGFAPPDVDEMKRLGNVLRGARRMLSEFKQEMYGEHKQECFERIEDIQKEHDYWWEELKVHRSKKQEEFVCRVQQNLEKNREKHERATDSLRRQRAHADDLRYKIDTAWNEGFISQASEWLSEAESKIEDIEGYVRKLEEWIEEDEAKLRMR